MAAEALLALHPRAGLWDGRPLRERVRGVSHHTAVSLPEPSVVALLAGSLI